MPDHLPYTIHVGDCLHELQTLPDESVHCCITSPPYFGLRDYGVDEQIGLEQTPAEFVARLVEVFREVRRVLRDDGTLWVNMGDSYASIARHRLAAAWLEGAAQMDIFHDTKEPIA
ncbi:DNA methylase N-4/N-6 [Pseudomonas aeruginosa PA45]|nr:DNA methyltransferase [Pseudomonas aeruginosa]ENH93615.1 DNA methylase N-4/N-6 [Pseudomonas aeruginosa PA45]